ncbi:MAG: GntR family transcriptional regulator [Actinomycetota bacterium]
MSPRTLDRSSSTPLWAQLETDLRERVDAGEFDSGRFPTDQELVDEYGVSRHTVREAIAKLNAHGLLTRERGRGTVINRAEFEQSLGTLYSLFRSIESTGVEQTSDVLELGLVRDVEAARQLGSDPDVELLLIARLRRAGGDPLAIDRAWLPASFAEPLLRVDWGHTALYDELRRLDAPVPNQGWERVSPVLPTAADQALLGIGPRDAAFHLERLGTRDGTPVEWRTTVIRGDRYRFVADWSAGSAPALRPAPS